MPEMEVEFLESIRCQLQREGYLTENAPKIPGVQSRLYARSPQGYRLGFAKVQDHFMFIDWEKSAFGRLDRLIYYYQCFSEFVNQSFHIPHALRTEIPNLALVAVAGIGFSSEIIQFTRETYLNPWYGGETGQVILVDRAKKMVITHPTPVTRQPGSLPLVHAAEIIQAACVQAFLIS